MDMGTKIKLLRVGSGMTQEELGKLLGVKRAAINKYESGIIVNLKRSTIEELCKIFDVSPQFLLDDNYTPPRTYSEPEHPPILPDFTHEELLILAYMRELNDEGKALVVDYMELLDASGKYKKHDSTDMEEKTTA